jgi:hypothetical protein
MTTKLLQEKVIPSKIVSVSVSSVTVRHDGVVVADWQGIDSSGMGVLRQQVTFMPDAVASLLEAPTSEIIARAEAAIVQALGSSPPKIQEVPPELAALGPDVQVDSPSA